MRAYATNILPADAAYYTLANATLSGGDLHLLAGGSATINVNETQLTSLTEYFKVAATMTPSSGAYAGGTFIVVKAVSSSGEYITHYCNVVTNTSDLYSAEIELIAGEYKSLQVIIQSATECLFTNWELCPELESSAAIVEINGVKQSLPKLLADYNTTELIVEQSEQVVAMICCYLLADTDIQGHFTMNCYASERSTLHIRFTDNNMIELFCPLLFTVNPGLTTIAIPHAFLTKLTGAHNFVVTAQVTNGYVRVPIRSVLFTIDGGYLLSRLMNPGMDVCDIAIMRLVTDDKPSQIWAVGIDNSIITVKHRSYDPKNYNESWAAVCTLGAGTEAAIEFNGAWKNISGTRELITEDVPWEFFILNGTLYAQYGAQLNTKIILATGVVKVAALRAWLFQNSLADNDMGLIVAYIKTDGYAYYRQYYQALGGTPTWLIESQIPFTLPVAPYSKISMARLNDYRVAFTVQDSTGNSYSIITDRYYQADSVKPVYLDATSAPTLNMAEPISPSLVSAYNISNTETIIVLDTAVTNPTGHASKFTITDAGSKSYAVTATTLYSNDTTGCSIKLTHATYMSCVNPIRIVFTNTAYTAGGMCATNDNSLFAFANATLSFTATDYTPHVSAYAAAEHLAAITTPSITLVPIVPIYGHATEHLTEITNPVISLMQVTYVPGYATEHIYSQTIPAITLTHVGSSPL